MAVQFNDLTAIGDVIEIHTQTPIMGVQSISGFVDVVLNETGTRFFTKEFRYSTNGVTYSAWAELTNQNLADTFVEERDIFDIQYRYTRSGTSTVGVLTFVSIQLLGIIVEQSNPRIFTDLYFNKFFNYNDSSVLNWALNVLNKLYQRGIVANYMERGQDGVDDDDYIAFFGALTHFMAILVRYAREFQDFTLNDILLGEYLNQKGVFVNDGMNLASLQTLLENVYVSFLERGTNEIAKETGVDGRTVDGELLRLIRKGQFDEFIWGLIEPEKTIWNVNNNSPLYKGTKGSVNLIKAYEFTQDVTLLANYPLIESSYITQFTDSSKEVIRILNVDSPSGTIISGIGDAENQSKLILIDSRLSYEVTFQVRQAALGDYFSLKVNLYDVNEVLLTDSPISAISGAFTNTAIDTESLLKNDEYYFVRLILFNENIPTDAGHILDIGFGNHFIINNSFAKYMSVELGVETTDGGSWDGANDLRIYDFKVRPLATPIPNAFVMIPNVITSFMDNNSEKQNRAVENEIKRYLIPYNSILKNQFIDELFVPAGTPLTMSISFTNETILGANNGTITIIAVGGKAPYQYSIDNGVMFQSTGIFTNLAPATYNILVEDFETTQVTDTVVIAQGTENLDFQAFVTPSSRLDLADGQIVVLASGGTPSYFYSRDGVNFFVSDTFTGLLANDYTIHVRDTATNEINKLVTVGTIRDRAVTFTVVDELAAPVGTVNIAVISENYLTNGSGIVIIYLEDGSYSFVLTKSGYRPVTLSGIAITADRLIDVIIQTYYSITFIVKDNFGVGVTSADITTIATPPTQTAFSIQTPSGSDTVIKSDNIAGNYSFRISKDGYKTQIEALALTMNDTLNVVLEKLKVLSFTVKTGTGSPIDGARIAATLTPVGQSGFTVFADSLGDAQQIDLLAGLYSFSVTAPNFISGSLVGYNLTVDDTIDFVLAHDFITSSLFVTVRDSITSQLLDNTDLILRTSPGLVEVDTGITDVNGEETLTGHPDGTYLVEASRSGYIPKSETVVITGGLGSVAMTLRPFL